MCNVKNLNAYKTARNKYFRTILDGYADVTNYNQVRDG